MGQIGRLGLTCIRYHTSLVAKTVKDLPAVWETWVRSRGQEDRLERGMATTHSSIHAWRIPWTEKSGGPYIVHGVAKSWTQLSD